MKTVGILATLQVKPYFYAWIVETFRNLGKADGRAKTKLLKLINARAIGKSIF